MPAGVPSGGLAVWSPGWRSGPLKGLPWADYNWQGCRAIFGFDLPVDSEGVVSCLRLRTS